MAELQNRIEAILFASGKGVSEEDLAKLCQSTPKTIRKYAKQLQEEYSVKDSSLVISQQENKWKLTVRGKYLQDIEKITSETELSNSVLKTLAIVAFKSPVLQSTIIDMRGQGAYEHVKILAKQKFLTKDEQGRTYILKITDKFYNYFDIEGDDEIREVFDAMKKQQQRIIESGIIAAEQEQAKRDVKQQELQESVQEFAFTREHTQEDKDEQEAFLNNIDSRISKTALRLEQDDLMGLRKPKLEDNPDENTQTTTESNDSDVQKQEIETAKENDKKEETLVDEKEPSVEEKETTESNNSDVQENTNSQKTDDEKELKKDNRDYKKELEEFAQEESKKEEEKEQFL